MNQFSADQLIQYTTWAFYVVIFSATLARAVRKPLRTNIDISLFFTCTFLIIFLGILTSLGVLLDSLIIRDINTSLLLALAYLLMRLTDDFWVVPRWLMRTAEIGLAVVIAGTILFNLYPPAPGLFVLVELLYLMGFLAYSAQAFVRASRRTTGVTYRRMRAVALGSAFLVAEFAIAGLGYFLLPNTPDNQILTKLLTDICGLASGISYFLGFATPSILRRAWQEPELRAFLGRAANLPRLPDTRSIIREMEHGAASSLGAPRASIGLWNEADGLLQFELEDDETFETPPRSDMSTGRAFIEQRPIFTPDLQQAYPQNAEITLKYGATSLLAAPITAGQKRLGVLSVYAPRAPIFAEDDLALVQLLADQAAVVLESRALIDEAARVRAREEVTRLKEDFLSAAAHDLKTPLTTLVAQTQLLERRVLRAPSDPIDLNSIQKLVRESERLRSLVLELLDASRAEQGRLVTELEEVDLTALAHDTCSRYTSERHPCTVDAAGPVRGTYDRNRILQLFENLVENAVKYSPQGGEVCIKIWNDGSRNHITVSDQGIGIPTNDLPHIFDRFQRGTNLDDRKFAGMGLGLFICRGIAEQHGGQIKARSTPGAGTTFEVILPVVSTHTGAIPAPTGEKVAS